jgi:propanol-preferring alcohol dehydrogenase
MKAMLLERLSDLDEVSQPLTMVELPSPVPAETEVLIKVSTCGVCHTELDEIEGRTPPPKLPVIPGHQVVGHVADVGNGVSRLRIGERVGIAWINSACGKCRACREGNENLCPRFRATGRDVDGGYAEYMTVPADFTYPIPALFSDTEAAPLLCAGAIGFRSLRLTGLRDGENLGLTGFGASAHLVIKMVRYQYPHSKVFVFSRTPDEREFARQLGAFWSGDIGDEPPEKLRAAIDTTPAWRPVAETLKNLEAGGRLVINAIRKEERDKESLLTLDYSRHLWMEKEIRSVANITRADVTEFLRIAAAIPIRPEVEEFRLDEANRALRELKERRIRGAKVLKIG